MRAHKSDGNLELFEYELGSLKPDEVEIDVEYCGICHSDLHMLKNEWGLHTVSISTLDMKLLARYLQLEIM